MTFKWKDIVVGILAALAAKGGLVGGVAALLAQFILPLISDAEKLSLATAAVQKAEGATAPDEFKKAVRDYLTALVNRIPRPLVRLILQDVLTNLSDTIIDTAYRIVTGGELPAMAAEAAPDHKTNIEAAAVKDLHDVASR